ncbi:hypothetical protein AB0K48_19140 [Nonomuraea sp. NPDC055795]
MPIAPGGPPFTMADGVLFEVETLDPGVRVAFWRVLGVPGRVAGSAWRSFQFRQTTACATLPDELHVAAGASTWQKVRRAARIAGPATGSSPPFSPACPACRRFAGGPISAAVISFIFASPVLTPF